MGKGEAQKAKKYIWEKREGFVDKRNGSLDGASEDCTNCKVLRKGEILYKGEAVGED